MPLPELAPPREDTPLQLAPGDMIQKGWLLVKPQLAVVIVVLLLAILVSVVLHHVPFAGAAMAFVWQLVIGSGLYNYMWRTSRGEKVGFEALFVPIQDKAGGIIIVSILSALAIIVSLVFLVIPGIYVAMALSLSMPLVTLTTASATDAMALSWRIVNRNLVDFIVLTLVVMAMNLGGLLLLGVGLLVTIPVSLGIQLVVMTQLLATATVASEPRI